MKVMVTGLARLLAIDVRLHGGSAYHFQKLLESDPPESKLPDESELDESLPLES